MCVAIELEAFRSHKRGYMYILMYFCPYRLIYSLNVATYCVVICGIKQADACSVHRGRDVIYDQHAHKGGAAARVY